MIMFEQTNKRRSSASQEKDKRTPRLSPLACTGLKRVASARKYFQVNPKRIINRSNDSPGTDTRRRRARVFMDRTGGALIGRHLAVFRCFSTGIPAIAGGVIALCD